MKYVNDLITEVRRDTRNEEVPTDTTEVGIATNDFLRYINFAQEKCQAVAISNKSTKFQTVGIISLVSGTVEYPINDRVYLDEHILNVEFSSTGLVGDYYEIREKGLSYRNDASGIPSFYIRSRGGLLLCPAYNSSGATIRVTYDRAVDSLDIRRGTISSHTASATALTALTLDPTTDDATSLGAAQYICVNDQFGNVKMRNIPVTGYNNATGVVSISGASYTFATGETIANSDYVTVGRDTTTHCKLNDLCEKYLAQYAEYKIFRRDSSSDASGAREDMKETLREIATSYSEAPRDEVDIQIDNQSLIVGAW